MGRRYSHIVDPRTGWGVTSRVAATVIARDGITSDSLATALCVLGKEVGKRLIRTVPGARAYIREVRE
jgi:thiamine biosynthesis lipoprotein